MFELKIPIPKFFWKKDGKIIPDFNLPNGKFEFDFDVPLGELLPGFTLTKEITFPDPQKNIVLTDAFLLDSRLSVTIDISEKPESQKVNEAGGVPIKFLIQAIGSGLILGFIAFDLVQIKKIITIGFVPILIGVVGFFGKDIKKLLR